MEFLYSLVMHLLLEHSSGCFVIKSSHEPFKLFEENYATTMLSSSQIEEKFLLNTSRHPAKDEAWRFSSPPIHWKTRMIRDLKKTFRERVNSPEPEND